MHLHLQNLEQVLQLLENQASSTKIFFVNKIILPNIVFRISKTALDSLKIFSCSLTDDFVKGRQKENA